MGVSSRERSTRRQGSRPILRQGKFSPRPPPCRRPNRADRTVAGVPPSSSPALWESCRWGGPETAATGVLSRRARPRRHSPPHGCTSSWPFSCRNIKREHEKSAQQVGNIFYLQRGCAALWWATPKALVPRPIRLPRPFLGENARSEHAFPSQNGVVDSTITTPGHSWRRMQDATLNITSLCTQDIVEKNTSHLLIFSHSRIFFQVSSFMLLWMETTTSMSPSSVSSALPLRLRAFLRAPDGQQTGMFVKTKKWVCVPSLFPTKNQSSQKIHRFERMV